MPFYEYRCERGHTFEVLQRMSDDPVTACTTCGKPVERVMHPVAVHFKGSGFYSTDYGNRRAGSANDSATSEDGAKDGAKDEMDKKKDGGSESGPKSDKAASTSSD